MLILRRKEGQWIEITHRSGDKIRIRVCNIRARYPGQLDLVLDDPDHHFVIQRAERGPRAREALPITGVSEGLTPADDVPGLTTHPGGDPAIGIIPMAGIGGPS
ncbi:MAG: hypothetical protein AB7I30_06825 [Isosphaeraceae bacterium]